MPCPELVWVGMTGDGVNVGLAECVSISKVLLV